MCLSISLTVRSSIVKNSFFFPLKTVCQTLITPADFLYTVIPVTLMQCQGYRCSRKVRTHIFNFLFDSYLNFVLLLHE